MPQHHLWDIAAPIWSHLERPPGLGSTSSKRSSSPASSAAEAPDSPTAKKLQAVARRNGPRVVLANGTEGEPASQKDQVLMSREPHLVLDGAALAALAVGASEIRVGIDRSHTRAFEAMRTAIGERQVAEPSSLPIKLFGTPSRFVTGEETALVQWMDGGPGVPRGAPTRPFERGVSGRPTLVQNVETLAHMTQIAAFRSELGPGPGHPGRDPGTRLVTISGPLSDSRE